MNMKTLPSRFKSIWKPLAGVVALVLIVIWTTGTLTSKTPPGQLDIPPGNPLPPNAEKIISDVAPIATTLDAVGTVSAEETARLSAQRGGIVTETLASAGDRVARDQILIRLDDRDLQKQRLAALADLRQAETEYQRTQRLRQTDAATEQQLIAAETAFAAAEARLNQLDVLLTYTEIRAPFAGIITDRMVETGDLAHPGQVLIILYNPDTMRFDADVPARLMPRIKLGASAMVHLDRPDRTLTGEVAEIVAAINPDSRTQQVRVRLHHPESELFPGMFGRLWIDAEPREGIVLPAATILRMGQLEMVQVVEGDRVLRRLVRTRPVRGSDHLVEITSGLAGGETLLSNPTQER